MKSINNYIISIVSILIVLSLIEIILRIKGDLPRDNNFKINKNNEPVVYQEDSAIGWIHRPGNYTFTPWSKEGKYTNFKVNDDLSRSTYYKSNKNNNIFFIGGSLTQGWAVDDKDNYVSLFQKEFTNYRVKNYGVGGYGGYQSLLLLEKVIKNSNNLSHVFYGFIPHHEVRNVAAGSWVSFLNKHSRRGHASVPYASIDKAGNLLRHQPSDYLKIYFGDKSSLITKIEKRIMKIRSKRREVKQVDISKKIIEEMKNVSEKKGAKFHIILINKIKEENLNNYNSFFNNKKISVANCQVPEGSGFNIIGEGHPNRKAYMIVKNCLSNYFKKIIKN